MKERKKEKKKKKKKKKKKRGTAWKSCFCMDSSMEFVWKCYDFVWKCL